MSAEQQLVKATLTAWKTNTDKLEAFFAPLSDEQLAAEVAPGRNRLVYLLGHMAAVHDRMLPLLGAGERLHPELDQAFLTNPDRQVASSLTGAELKAMLAEVDAALWGAVSQWTAADWLSKHTAVSDEDFAKEPHRNRFSVLLSRLTHMSSHHGQIILAAPHS